MPDFAFRMVVEPLLDNRTKIGAQDDQRMTALHLKVDIKNLEVARLLLGKGEDISAEDIC